MKKINFSFCLLASLCFLLFSCKMDLFSQIDSIEKSFGSGNGEIQLILPGASFSRSLLDEDIYADDDLFSDGAFYITLLDSKGNKVDSFEGKQAERVTFGNLDAGDYTIKGEFKVDNDCLAQGTKSVTVIPLETTYCTLRIVLNKITKIDSIDFSNMPDSFDSVADFEEFFNVGLITVTLSNGYKGTCSPLFAGLEYSISDVEFGDMVFTPGQENASSIQTISVCDRYDTVLKTCELCHVVYMVDRTINVSTVSELKAAIAALSTAGDGVSRYTINVTADITDETSGAYTEDDNFALMNIDPTTDLILTIKGAKNDGTRAVINAGRDSTAYGRSIYVNDRAKVILEDVWLDGDYDTGAEGITPALYIIFKSEYNGQSANYIKFWGGDATTIQPYIYYNNPTKCLTSSSKGMNILDLGKSGITNMGEKTLWVDDGVLKCILPEKATSYPSQFFQESPNIEYIEISENNTSYKTIDGILFKKDMSVLYRYPNKKKGLSYTIPETVTELYSYAFMKTELESISGTEQITEFGYTVLGDSKVKEFILNENASLSTLYIFEKSNLESITIPAGIISNKIGGDVFNSCRNLKSVTMLSSTPPKFEVANSNPIFKYHPADFKIYVPAGSIEAYRTATNWSVLAAEELDESGNIVNPIFVEMS